MWARAPFALAPFASTADLTNITPPGQQIPPGGTPSDAYTYAVATGTAPYALWSYGGAVPRVAYTGGGVLVAADPDKGVVRVSAWWPDAAQLQLIRIDGAGKRTPVRGGYPVKIAAATRRNACTNPSVEVSTAGWVAQDANTTMTRTQANAAAGTWTLRLTSTTTTTGALVPGTLAGGGAVTVGFGLRLTSLPAGATFTISWLTSGGTSAGSTVFTLTANQLSAALNAGTRIVFTGNAPAGAVTGSGTFSVTGLTIGQAAEIDAVTLERDLTDGSYFDGGSVGGNWTSTAHLSSSVLAPLVTVSDGEAPLDVPLVYEVYNPALTGGRMTAQPVVLESRGRTWLTHPSVGAPIVVDLRSVPSRTHPIERGVFRALNAPKATVITGPARYAPSGTITFNAFSKAEREDLMTRFNDGQPVLLRTPYEFHYPAAGQWLSLGDVDDDRTSLKAYHDVWLLSASYDEVDAPNPAFA